jgi:hypothetical protein
MRPLSVTFTMVAKDADAICGSQTATATGGSSLNLTGVLATAGSGTATFDVARHVGIHATGDNSAVTFSITGTDRYGSSLSESLAGPTGASVDAVTTANFKSVTGVTVDAVTVGPVVVGTASSADSQWVPMNWRAKEFQRTIECSKTNGSFTYGIEHTLDDLQSVAEGDAVTFADATITAKTASLNGSSESVVKASRVAISKFASGTLVTTIVQGG